MLGLVEHSKGLSVRRNTGIPQVKYNTHQQHEKGKLPSPAQCLRGLLSMTMTVLAAVIPLPLVLRPAKLPEAQRRLECRAAA